MTEPRDARAAPLAPQSRAVSTLARVIIALLVGFVAVVGVWLWRDVVRAKQVSALTATVERQSRILEEQSRVINAFARLVSSDAGERAAAREELAALAREASAANRRRSGGAGATPAPVTTRAPSTSQAPSAAPPTTGAPRSTTSTTRPCLSAVVARVCRP